MLKSFKVPGGGEVGIIALVVAILSLMVLPLPPWLIDLLLGVNITISVTLLMVTMYVPKPVSLSSFPSLLLFTTLYRLSLNIASTKSILLHADAGHIIESFGELVVGGNLVVGLVVFIIISTVQFIVIAKGSERVAEVGARFTLDALPGKQMSIDADLRSNLLTPDEARKKRATLAMESQLHGGMDGAMKFVKGDAIAGLLITAINIVAGICVGVAYHDMSALEAANRFSILSVGDAMVSQIPSLLLSVAAGVMLTRVADEQQGKSESLGGEITRQLGSNARALVFAAVLLLGFAAVPGFPWELFLVLAALLVFVAYRIRGRQPEQHGLSQDALPSMQRFGAKTNAPSILGRPPQLSCAVGVRVSADIMKRLNMSALDRAFEHERAQLQEDLGLPFPGVTMWIDLSLPASSCELLVHDVPHIRVELPAGQLMLSPSAARQQERPANCEQGPALELKGEPTWWVSEQAQVDRALTWRTERVIAHAAIALMRRHASLFLGIQEVQWALEQLGTSFPGLVTEVQKVLPPQRIADVLRRLLEEHISMRNLRAITESLIAWGPKEKDMLMLTEYVRGDLSRFLAHRAAGGQRVLSAVMLDTPVEQHIRQAIKQTPTGNYLALRPEEASFIIDRIEELTGASAREGLALVTSMDIRRYVRRMIEGRLDWLQVYSFQELDQHLQLNPLGRVTL